jgi:hypothetical protein
MKRVLSIVVAFAAWGSSMQSQDLGISARNMDLNFLAGQGVEVTDSFYYQLDSVYTYTSGGAGWSIDSKAVYEYDAFRNLRNYLFQFYASGQWQNGKRVTYAYAENNTILEKQTLKWVPSINSWEYVWKKNYQQDINTGDLNILYSEWGSENWVDKWRQVQNYDETGKLTAYNTKNYNAQAGAWEEYWNYSCLYSQEGELLELLNESYDAESKAWIDEWQCIYEYNTEGQLQNHQIIDWDEEASNWESVRTFSVTPLDEGIGTVEVREDWDAEADNWVKSMQYTKRFDMYGKQIEALQEKWDAASGTWIPNRKDTYKYNEDGIQTEESTYFWDETSNSWGNHLKTAYHYSVMAIEKPIDPEDSYGDFYVYPNPAIDVIYLSNLAEASLLTIYSVDGKAVLEKQMNHAGESIDVSQLTKGMYIAVLSSERGERTAKFFKQ